MKESIQKNNTRRKFFMGVAIGWLIPMAFLDPIIAGPPLILLIIAAIYDYKANKP